MSNAILAIENEDLFTKARQYFEAKDLTKAVETCLAALKQKDDLETNILYVRSLINLKKYSVAQAHIKKIRDTEQYNDHRLDELAAHIHTKKGDFEQSITLLENALKKNPNLKAATTILARLYYLQNNYEKASFYIEKSIRHSPNKFDVLALKGRIEMALNKPEEAQKSFRMCEELAPSCSTAIDLANAELALGDLAEYQNYLLKADQRSFAYLFFKKSLSHTQQSRKLYITLSPHAGNFILRQYPFDGDIVTLNDQSDTFYTYSRDHISRFLTGLIQENKYEKIFLTGSSKGGTGVIQISTKLAEIFPDIIIKAFAFSPQIAIWPYNSNLKIHSYWTLKERCTGNNLLEKMVHLNGDINKLCETPARNLSITVLYGKHHEMDAEEINKISTAKIKIIPLEFSAHQSLMIYTLPENITKEKILSKYSSLRSLDEDSDSLSSEGNMWLDELIALHATGEYTLEKLFEQN